MEVCPKGMKSNGKIYFRTVAYEGGGRTAKAPPPLGPRKDKKWGEMRIFYEKSTNFWVYRYQIR